MDFRLRVVAFNTFPSACPKHSSVSCNPLFTALFQCRRPRDINYSGFHCRRPCSINCILPTFSNWRNEGIRRSFSLCQRAQSTGSRSILDFNEEDYADAEEVITEEEARRRNWVIRGWAPWEEVLSPEAQFAIDSLGQGKKDPDVLLKSFNRLTGKADKKTKFEEEKATEPEGKDDIDTQQREISSERSPPQVFSLLPPRDWPPPGWKVDSKELAFIREAHSLEDVRISLNDLENPSPLDETSSFARWKVFMKQYNEWVAANKDILDKEVTEAEEEYYPGRRRTGDDYEEGMYELPFIHPGQHYTGVVTCVHLYEGAFVYYGGVHDGWVPIKGNDWYYIRHHIKVGMVVQVEVLAKRDPYRFRFPVEMRFVNPNIDNLIFRRFEYPPVFLRANDTNWDELARETGRPYVPRRRPETKNEEEITIFHHPYSPKVWKMHTAEQMVLDHEDGSAEIYDNDGNLLEDFSLDSVGDTEKRDPNETFWIEDCKLGEAVLPKIVMIQDEEELDIDAARVERKAILEMSEEAEAKGEAFLLPKLKRELYMDLLDQMHDQRSVEEFEALQRDKYCRIEAGLPLEEPGRYADPSFFEKNPYNPREKRWRHDYFSDPTRFKEDTKKDKASRQRVPSIIEEEEGDPSLWISKQTGKSHPNGRPHSNETEQHTASDAVMSSQLMSTLGDTNFVNGTKVVDLKGMLGTEDDWEDEKSPGES